MKPCPSCAEEILDAAKSADIAEAIYLKNWSRVPKKNTSIIGLLERHCRVPIAFVCNRQVQVSHFAVLFIGVGFTASKYLVEHPLPAPYPPSFGHWIVLISFVISLVVAIQYILKISMFSRFINESAEIAKTFEDRLIVNQPHRLTDRFNQDRLAGPKGDPYFKTSLLLLAAVAFVGICFSIRDFFV